MRAFFICLKRIKKRLYIICISVYNRICNKKTSKGASIMRSIPVPMIVWLPALVWFVTYELTKFHGIKGWLKANTD